MFIVARHNMGHLPVSVSVIPSPCFINLPPFMGPENGSCGSFGRPPGGRRRVGRTQAPAEPRSGEVGAGRLLDVLPAHLIPGGGPLSSMTMWWVSGRRRAGWVAGAGGGGVRVWCWRGQAGPGWGAVVAGLVPRKGSACSLQGFG